MLALTASPGPGGAWIVSEDGEGHDAGRRPDIGHKILAGFCEIR